jgi:hypothetical protein
MSAAYVKGLYTNKSSGIKAETFSISLENFLVLTINLSFELFM